MHRSSEVFKKRTVPVSRYLKTLKGESRPQAGGFGVQVRVDERRLARQVIPKTLTEATGGAMGTTDVNNSTEPVSYYVDAVGSRRHEAHPSLGKGGRRLLVELAKQTFHACQFRHRAEDPARIAHNPHAN
jgi:hypothetical protein